MKSKLLISLFMLSCLSSSFAQNIRLNTYAAYVFDNHVDSYFDNSNYYKGVVNGGFQWGAGIEYMEGHDYGIELLYQRQDTKAPITYYKNGIKFTNFDLAMNYIMLGGNRYFTKRGSKLEGYGGGMVGMDIIGLKNPDNGNSTTKVKLAWGIRGGLNVWATPKVGIKLQAQLLSAVQSVGGGFYFGTGGSGAGLSAYSTIFQFGLGGGLVFNISPQKK